MTKTKTKTKKTIKTDMVLDLGEGITSMEGKVSQKAVLKAGCSLVKVVLGQHSLYQELLSCVCLKCSTPAVKESSFNMVIFHHGNLLSR